MPIARLLLSLRRLCTVSSTPSNTARRVRGQLTENRITNKISSSPLREFTAKNAFWSRPQMDANILCVPHEERTSTEPRDPNTHYVRLAKVDEINPTIRLLKLKVSDEDKGIKFLPGQWLDVFLPGVAEAGGFTLTSTPAHAAPVFSESSGPLSVDPLPVEEQQNALRPYLELAVQQSPLSKPAVWIWQPTNQIEGATLKVRVGGSFIWPPPTSVIATKDIKKVVFVAGGVGINPLISMISHLHHTNSLPPSVEFLYASKLVRGGQILFADRLLNIAEHQVAKMKLKLFLTQAGDNNLDGARLKLLSVEPSYRRMTQEDVIEALGSSDRDKTVCYVCGPPQMTDELVGFLRNQGGMDEARVMCEKWW